ncbi:MAG: phosphotransferase [Streptomyces sp.]|uniref:phosphotransferase n=1 Tax=Streptomyces sp. TaxID=1931 RepID=UPI0025E2A374|nr:phosphotransferase [Streptomyces sp.]MBW8797170.1 phosphotransferase [Streptomyces sp.]
MTADVLPQLTARIRAAAHPGPTSPCACGTTTLAHRPDTTVLRHAATVAKAHAPDTDPTALTLRLAIATGLPDVFLPPLAPAPAAFVGDRPVTLWPYGAPLDPDAPEEAPWEAAATLLALLHRTPPTAAAPPMRGPAKAAHAMARLGEALAATGAHPAAAPVLRAWSALPPWARAEAPVPDRPRTLCHGDLHLGQLVRYPAPDGPWRLIDVDDLGVGDPAWDLARPAAWYACGLLPPDEWSRFLGAYRAAGGPAVPQDGDPWAALDVPARALTVQTGARYLAKAIAADRPLDTVEQSLIDACARMAPE